MTQLGGVAGAIRRMFGSVFPDPRTTSGLVRLLATGAMWFLMSRNAHANMVDDFKDHLAVATAGWMDKGFLVAKALFVIVMGVGMANHLAGVAEKNGTIEGWGREVLGYLRAILPGYVLLLIFQPVMSTIVDKALALTGFVTGYAITQPGQVIDAANRVLDALWKGVGASGDPIALPIIAAICSIVLYYVYARLAAELVIVYARQFVALSVLAMELGWAGAPGTANFASDVYGAVRKTFYHAVVVVALIAFGLGEASNWENLMANPPDGNLLRTMVSVVGDVIFFYVIASGVTEFADGVLQGNVGVSGSRAVDSGRNAVAGAAAGAGGQISRGFQALRRGGAA